MGGKLRRPCPAYIGVKLCYLAALLHSSKKNQHMKSVMYYSAVVVLVCSLVAGSLAQMNMGSTVQVLSSEFGAMEYQDDTIAQDGPMSEETFS